MGALPRPDLPAGPLRALSDRLHDLHHEAGWPSLRDLAREVGCSHTTISATFSEPRLPRWGLLEILVEALDGDTAEFHRLWLAAGNPAAPVPPAPPASGPVPRELPADVLAFTGRTAQLAALDGLLAAAESSPAMTVATIAGTAGVGKTALAIHWAHHVAERFPDGQLYVNLRGYDPDQPLHAADALEALLRSLGVTTVDLPRDVAERAGRYRTLMAGRRMLVVLDNAHSVDQLRDLLPGTPSCFTVVTSRDTLPALVARHGAARVNLDLLSPEESLALLRTLIGSRVDEHPADARALARRCARLPLALRIAAELAAARPAVPLASLVDELGEQSRRLDLLAAGDDEYTAVRAVFSWSLRHLDTAAATGFTLLGLHPGAEFDLATAAALTGADAPTARRLLNSLARVHLLDSLAADRYGRHDLLRAYAAERAGALPVAERQAALARLRAHCRAAAAEAVRVAFSTAGGASPTGAEARFGSAAAAVGWLDSERTSLIAIATDEPGAHTTGLSATLAPYLDARGHYLDALGLHELAQTTARTSGDRPAEGRAAAALATVFRRLGDYRRSAAHYERALVIHRETGDRASEGGVLHGLGLAHWRLGHYPEALAHLGDALTIYCETGDLASEGSARYGLGVTYHLLGRYADARAEHEQALAVQRGIGDRTGEGRTLNNLGLVYQRLAQRDTAREHYARSLEIAREVGNRAGEGVALSNLGDLDEEEGQYGAAKDNYERALAVCLRIGYRVGQAEAIRGLGVVALRLGHAAAAAAELERSVALCRELGERETEIRALVELGEALHAAGRGAEALDRQRTALDLAAETGDLYALAGAHDALAVAHGDRGEPAESAEHLRHALALYTTLGLERAADVRARLAAVNAAAPAR